MSHFKSRKIAWIVGSVLLFALLVHAATSYGPQFILIRGPSHHLSAAINGLGPPSREW